MAGYEVIGNEELDEIKDIFSNGGVLFRHGFDQIEMALTKSAILRMHLQTGWGQNAH